MTTDAELLIDIAREMIVPRNRMISTEGMPSEIVGYAIELAALAMRFNKQSPGFKL